MIVWVVTLQITECESPSKYLSFATINNGYDLYTADVNGQIILNISAEFTHYVINISVLGYISRNFTLEVGMNGTIQDVCLNPAHFPDGGESGGPSDGGGSGGPLDGGGSGGPPDGGGIEGEITGW